MQKNIISSFLEIPLISMGNNNILKNPQISEISEIDKSPKMAIILKTKVLKTGKYTYARNLLIILNCGYDE